MNYRRLGRSGAKVAPLAIGTLNFGYATDEAEAGRILARAIDAGVNMIDTANSYNGGASEQIIGSLVAEHGWRDLIVLATKVHFPVGDGPNDRGNSRLHIVKACEESLQRLQTDHIDLYQIHRPDPDTPVEETLAALTDLVRAGKVRYIGCSTHPAWRVMEALLTSEQKGYVRYVTEQPPYNLLDRRIENELVPLCLEHGVGLIPWAPMAQGVLAGRYADVGALPEDSRAATRAGVYAERVTPAGIAIGQSFAQLAHEAGLSAAQLALLWVKDQPGVVAPIFGPRTLAQLEEALPVLDMQLSDELRAACDQLVPPGSVAVNFHNSAAWMKMRVG